MAFRGMLYRIDVGTEFYSVTLRFSDDDRRDDPVNVVFTEAEVIVTFPAAKAEKMTAAELAEEALRIWSATKEQV